MTDDELRTLAVDIVEGKVFGSWMLPEADLHLIGNVFMPLVLGGAERLPEDASCLYEYLDKRLPLTVNGHPTFLSFRFLTETERQALVPKIRQYRTLKAGFLQVEPEPAPRISIG